MSDLKGTQYERNLQAQFEKERKRMMEDFQRQREKITQESQVRIGNDKFISQSDAVEDSLKQSTVGLVQLEDFKRIRSELEWNRALERPTAMPEFPSQVKASKRRKATAEKLSFDPEELINEDETLVRDVTDSAIPKRPKFGKDPTVDTSFLPDQEREDEERRERELLRNEWLEKQARVKDEPVRITYSYWDGSGHRSEVQVKKGDTIKTFLLKARSQFESLRNVNVDNLMYVKEDLIIPHHYTFYDFILNKVKGKTGPLFCFDVHEDIRLLNDARIEKDESHAGKIVLRSWYEKNKHLFPANIWEVFDPERKLVSSNDF